MGLNAAVPGAFLTDVQCTPFGSLSEEPSRTELEQFVVLDDAGRALVEAADGVPPLLVGQGCSPTPVCGHIGLASLVQHRQRLAGHRLSARATGPSGWAVSDEGLYLQLVVP